MTQTKIFRLSTLLAIVGLLMALLLPAVPASALTNSSLLLSDPRTGETSDYTLTTSGLTTGTTINCIQLDIGTASDGTGDVGLDLSSVDVTTETITSGGAWADASVDGTTDQLRYTSAGGATPNASGSITWDDVVNGSTEGATYYGVFETFSNTDCSTGGPVDSVTVAFTYKDGELVQLTIDPTLTFTCSDVASGLPVNGVNTTVASTASGINHGNSVTFGAKGISAHDLNVTTNAPGGYTVYIRHTGQLTNGSDNIANHTGTNAAPTAFPAAGTEAWGYTTEDNTLGGGGATRFTAANGYAGFTTTNEPVMDNTGAAPSGDTVRVGHQVGVANTTPSGTYQTTIVYTVASVY